MGKFYIIIRQKITRIKYGTGICFLWRARYRYDMDQVFSTSNFAKAAIGMLRALDGHLTRLLMETRAIRVYGWRASGSSDVLPNHHW